MSVHLLNTQLLQEDLELEQVRVNSLTHMVVVVDENSGDSATAALESKLQVRLQQQGYTLHRAPLFVFCWGFFIFYFSSTTLFSAPMFSTGGSRHRQLKQIEQCIT